MTLDLPLSDDERLFASGIASTKVRRRNLSAKYSSQFRKICYLCSVFRKSAEYYSAKMNKNRNKGTMATEENLDEIDIKILKLLQQNSRLTVKELAARVHLSPSPTFERQKRLEREGYIQRYGAIVDHHKMGHNVIVLCNIRLKQHTHDLIQQFMDTVQTIDQITECYNTTGDYDFQIKVYARDMKAYQDFMLNTLGNINCIGSLHSIIVIGEIKDSHYIPVAK